MDQKELLRTIARAAEEGWTKLNLSNQGIAELSSEIGNLTNLTELDLSCNQLSALPPEFGKW
ncbi:hypothetical protein U27_04823 [Candidatus Vecturithrix granuli]|uniref:Uncharacterized protein n=1 Tax=Vecturithrix granuli TaxID=1499967 RepID=A0A081BZU6_VECG1|nr:hypothetical protein U27_04823 [Candidatus Vecturithrix granuli]